MVLPLALAEKVGITNSYHGPFRSSAGDVYTILIESGTNDAEIVAFKGVDPTVSFVEQDSSNRPQMSTTSTNGVVSLNCFQKSDILYVSTQESVSEQVFHAQFDMDADAWVDLGSSDFDIAVDTTTDANLNACDICVLDNNKVRIVYQGEQDKVMGTPQERIHHAWSTDGGGSFTAALTLSAVGDEGDSTGPRIVTDGVNAWVVWKQTHDTDTNNLFEASIHPDDSVQTLQDTGEEFFSGLSPISHGVVFDRLGTKKVRFAFNSLVGSGDTEVLEFDVTQDPTSFGATSLDTGTTPIVGNDITVCLAADGSTVHEIQRHTDGDLFSTNDQDIDSWVALAERRDATNINNVSCNVFWRDGGPKLAMIYRDGTTPTYDELAITHTLGNLSDAILADQNQFAGPVEVV